MMKMERYGVRGLILATLFSLTACAHAPLPYKTPVSVSPPTGRLAVAHAVNLLDASGSETAVFPTGRATLESLVAAMPSGRYQASNLIFGGYEREGTPHAGFNRGALASSAKNASFLEGTTPIFDVIENDLATAIGGTGGKAAIVLISDGKATDYAGHAGAGDRTIAAAKALAKGRQGTTCFHTVQLGSSPAGARLLEGLAAATGCGSFRTAASLNSASALQAFSREAYLGGRATAPPPRPITQVKPGDGDGDGVTDDRDACPNTLKKARVDARGCWTLTGIRFAVNSAEIAGDWETVLREDLDVLRANPGVRIRVDGHTDSDGSEKYNQGLSLRRATTVRDYFVSKGLDASRFDIFGFGESQPVAPNDTRENKRLNRRVELTIID